MSSFADYTTSAPAATVPAINATNNPNALALTIGDQVFDNDEHPIELAFGLSQALAKKITIGGGKVVQSLGSIHKDITWTGTLFDARAQPKVASLLQLSDSGQQVTLTYLGIYGFNVVVEDFTPTLLFEWQYTYSITVTVISSISGMTGGAAPTSIATQVASLLNQAMLTANQIAAQDASASSIPTAVQQVTALLASAQNLSAGIAVNPALVAAVKAALTVAQVYAAATPITNGTAQTLVNYLTLVYRNVLTGQSQVSFPAAGANWAELAAQFYGDASLGPTLAVANGSPSALSLSSNVIQNIVIPNLAGIGL